MVRASNKRKTSNAIATTITIIEVGIASYLFLIDFMFPERCIPT